MANNILSVADFDSILDSYSGRTISRTIVTLTTSNITGEETLVDGVTDTVKCHVMKTGQSFDFKKEGFMEQGDAIGLFKIADAIDVNHKVTINSEVFRVKEKYDVPGVFTPTSISTLVYTVANLFLIE